VSGIHIREAKTTLKFPFWMNEKQLEYEELEQLKKENSGKLICNFS
jgi:hypothetical protein